MPRADQDTSCIRVDIRGTEDTTELMSCLALQFIEAEQWEYNIEGDILPARGRKKQQVIVEDSDVIAFHLVRHPANEASNNPFKDPSSNEASKASQTPSGLFDSITKEIFTLKFWPSSLSVSSAPVSRLVHERKFPDSMGKE